MKVAVITDYFPSSATPWQGNSAYQTLRRLAANNEVHVFCSLPQYVFGLSPKSAINEIDRDWGPPDVDATYLRYPGIPLFSRPFNGFSIARSVLPHVRAFRPDVILNYAVYPHGFAAVRVAQRLGVPCVLTAIGSDLNRISGALSRTATRYALRKAAFVTTVSHDLAKTAIRLGSNPSKTRAILNGCDTTLFHPGDRSAARQHLRLDHEGELILYVGRMDVRKGLLELVQALWQLRGNRPAMRALFVGDGPDSAAVQHAISEKGIQDIARHLPAVSTTEVARYIAASDLVTLPSYNEGCPNVVLEALSSGRPVVATNVGGIPELLDHRSGRLVPPRDAFALAGALHQTLDTEWNAEEIAHRHQRSWSDVAADLADVLQHVVAHP